MDPDQKTKESLRFALLKGMYELTDGDPSQFVYPGPLAQAAGVIDTEELRKGARFLHDEGLVKVESWKLGMPGLLRITHAGVIEYEQATKAPNEATQHFSPLNVLYIQNMIGSSVQQGTIGSSQSISITTEAITELTKFVAELEGHLAKIGLDAEVEMEARADLESIKAQTKSPKPKGAVIRACLESLRHIFEHAGGAAIGHYLAVQAPTLLAQLPGLIALFK